MPTFRVISLGLLLVTLSGCTWAQSKTGGLFANKGKKNNRTADVKVVGVIDMVNPEQNYVLIHCEQRLNLPAGTEIIAQNSDGSKVKLKVSPERKGNYITADIKEGTPQVKDLVLYQIRKGELPAPGTLTASGATGTPAEGPAVNLTPIMQADVIPPLNAPFQSMAAPAPIPTAVSPPPILMAPPSAPRPAAPAEQSEVDLSDLPPVVR